MTRKLELINTNFSTGQISSHMLSREDVSAYAGAAETLENVIPHIQGSVSRRPGTKFLADLGADTRVIGFHFKDSQEYLFCLQSGQIEVRNPSTGALITTIGSCPWTTELWDIRYAQSGDTTIFVHPDFAMQKVVRTSATTFARSDYAFEEDSAVSGKLFQPYFKFADPAVTLTPSGTTGSINLTTSADHWTANHVNTIIRYKDKQVKITSRTSATVAVGTVIETLSGTSADESWDEAVFSAANGFARSVMFHGRRLWFGGTRDLPQHVMGSKTNAVFNFDAGSAEDDEAIFAQLGTDEVNEIRHTVSARHLLFNTDDGEFFQSETAEVKITPGNFNPRWQTGYGSGRARPLLIDGGSVFIQDSGKTVREMFFDDIQQAYKSDSINDLADDVLTSFDDTALFIGSSDRVEQFGLFVDQTSGNVAVYHTSRKQNLFGWYKWTTDGDFRSVAEVDDEVFFVVKRVINSVTKYYLEKLTDDYTTDCSSDVTRSTFTWGAAAHLAAKNIRAVNAAKTMDYGEFTLNTSGQFTYEHDDVSTLQVGLWFAPKVLPSRAVATAERGSISLKRKRLVRTIIDLKDTYAITIDGKDLQLREVNDDPSTAPDALNGTFDVYHLGWDRHCQRLITQSSALPMTVRALSREVAY